MNKRAFIWDLDAQRPEARFQRLINDAEEKGSPLAAVIHQAAIGSPDQPQHLADKLQRVVESLVDELQSQAAGRRDAAIGHLGDICVTFRRSAGGSRLDKPCKQSIEALLGMLADDSATVRMRVVETLSKAPDWAPDEIAAAVAAKIVVDDPVGLVRRGVALILKCAVIPPGSVIQQVVQLLRHPRREVGIDVCAVLGKFETAARDAVPDLVNLIASTSDTTLRTAAAASLHGIDPSGGKIITVAANTKARKSVSSALAELGPEGRELSAKLEKYWTPIAQSPPGAGESLGPLDPLVTLKQIADHIGYEKRTLEGWDLPTPEIRSRGNKPAQWRWSTIHPFLVEEVGETGVPVGPPNQT